MGIAAEDDTRRVASKLDAPFSARRLSVPADQERQRRIGMDGVGTTQCRAQRSSLLDSRLWWVPKNEVGAVSVCGGSPRPEPLCCQPLCDLFSCRAYLRACVRFLR